MSLTAIAFVLAFLGGCVLAFVRHPIYGLMTYVGAFYLHPPSRWWGQNWMLDVRWSLIAAGVALAAILARRRTGPEQPFFSHRVVWGLVAFVLWLAVQSFWALAPEKHADLLSMFAKYIVVVFLILRCVENQQHLRLFLWAHVFGCLYLAWIAHTNYVGGRFEEFGGPGLGDANAAANQLVAGILVAASFFLAGRLVEKVFLLLSIPLVVNALVATMSRSGFLALAIGGIVFNLFAPPKFRRRIRVLSALALVLLLVLTNQMFWERMDTIKYRGEAVEGVDTGAGRLEIIDAQWRMFRGHPLGCGHRCTEVLAPSYLDARFLTAGGEGSRSSHNTFMTLLVEQGIPGAIFYVALLWWLTSSLVALARQCRDAGSFLASLYPAVAGTLAAITIGDLFVDFLKHEARIWFIAIVIVMQRLVMVSAARERQDDSGPAGDQTRTEALKTVRSGTAP